MATAGPALVFEAAEQGSVVMARVIGVINEDNALDERLVATRGKSVLIDLSNIERINSCGVRDWIRFAQRLEAGSNALYLMRCSPVVVAQLNMVRNFCGEKGQVVSFQAPYICPNCDEEVTETFPANQVSAGTSPDAICPNCKSPMEFDDIPDLYFAFAKIHGPKPVPPEIQSALENFRTSKLPSAATPSPATPAASAARPSRPGLPALGAAPAAPAAAAPAPAASGQLGGAGFQQARSPVPAAAPVARPASNPTLQARPLPTAAPAGSATAMRPSNPALQARPAAPSAMPMPMPRPASNPGLQAKPAVPPAAGAQVPAGMGVPAAARASGPKPAARPMMGGSPFPVQRPSGLKAPVGAAVAPPNGTPDPTKKS